MATDFGKLNFSVSFNPTSAFPLDARSYFESYNEAEAAAKSAKMAGDSTTTYYYGETVCVVADGKATLYTIQPDNSLFEVGGAIEVDENIFKFNDGALSLIGFADAVAGAQLVKTTDGLAWVKPDNTTVEGLQTSVETLRKDVDTLSEKVDENKVVISEKVGSVGAADNSISIGGTSTAPTVGVKVSSANGNTLEKKSDGLYVNVPEQVDYSVAVAESTPEGYAKSYTFSQNGKNITTINIPKDMVVESGKVVTNPTGQEKGTYIELVLANATNDKIYINVGDLIEYVTSGSTVNDQIFINISDDHKVTATLKEGSVTLAQLNSTVQASLKKADSALQQADLDTYKTEVATELQKKTNSTDFETYKSTISGELDKKADKSELESYTKTSEAEKTYATKSELSDGLSEKVSKEDGKVLSSNDYTDGEKSKLEGIEAKAQANILEAVQINGVALTPKDKTVNIPMATAAALGLVKGTIAENGVNIKSDGTMEVNEININKLIQTDGEVLILNGGSSVI